MTDHASAESPRNDANLELQSLEREKLRVEIEQLRSAARTRWITPTALATLLPLVAGLPQETSLYAPLELGGATSLFSCCGRTFQVSM
jgi:hypothetical protein